MFQAFIFHGYTNSVTTCDCCGRSDLKRTVALWAAEIDNMKAEIVAWLSARFAPVLDGAGQMDVKATCQRAGLTPREAAMMMRAGKVA